jgi:hypothetical protein
VIFVAAGLHVAGPRPGGAWPVQAKGKLRKAVPAARSKGRRLRRTRLSPVLHGLRAQQGQVRGQPSKAVDAYWHAFILDTRSYAEWCERTLGRFLHRSAPADAPAAPVRARHEAGHPRGSIYSLRPRPPGVRAESNGGAEMAYGADFADASFSGDPDAMGRRRCGRRCGRRRRRATREGRGSD